MPRRQTRDLDARDWAYLDQSVHVASEIAWLRMGADPSWECPHLDGVDISDRPELWTPYQRARREAYDARVAGYGQRGLI